MCAERSLKAFQFSAQRHVTRRWLSPSRPVVDHRGAVSRRAPPLEAARLWPLETRPIFRRDPESEDWECEVDQLTRKRALAYRGP